MRRLEALTSMKYPGRGIIAAEHIDGGSVIVYFLTGRSPPSRARELVRGENTGVIRTNPTDPKELERGSAALLLYPAIVPVDRCIVASNGAQTTLLYNSVLDGECNSPKEILQRAFRSPSCIYDAQGDRWIDITSFEPDRYHTPRISLVSLPESGEFGMHIVRDRGDGQKAQEIFPFELSPGMGKLMTTYQGRNVEPLPSFIGDPLEVEIPWRTAEEIAKAVYSSLQPPFGSTDEEDFRVSVAAVHASPPYTSKNIDHYIMNRREIGGG